MGRTLVESERVWKEIQKKHPGRKLVEVLHRGNYPNLTFLAIFSDSPKGGEVVNIPPVRKRRTPRTDPGKNGMRLGS